MTEILQDYVRAVAKNVACPLVEPIDLVIGGGAFNGAYGLGAVLVIKELEIQKKVRVERISGCSIGGLLALAYICDICSEVEKMFSAIRDCLKRDGCMHSLRDMITKIVEKAFIKDETTILNGRLFLSHTDLSTMKPIVTSEYEDKASLVEALIRTCFVPLLIDGNTSLENRYVDGVVPHLFKDGARDSLYVNLIDYKTLFKVIVTRNEANSHYRVMQGAADASHFFVEGNSRMCSWVSKWGIAQYGTHRATFMIFTMVALFIDYVSNITFPQAVTGLPVVRLVMSAINQFLRDIIYSLSA
jgi:hypothetical protein